MRSVVAAPIKLKQLFLSKNKVSVVIPIYKTNLSQNEQMALRQCLKILKPYKMVIVHPKSLDISSFSEYPSLNFEPFHDDYFKSISGYNRLMLSTEFYERFLNSEYILIHQLDAFVFRDELLYWCNRAYDYIGAPWIATPKRGIHKLLSHFQSAKKRKRTEIFYKVGNGGFSLRHVQRHFEISKTMRKEIEKNLLLPKGDFRIMEDVFWSITVPKTVPNFKIPDYKEGLKFAFDRKPKLAFKLNNNELPFGCHGFEKPKVKAFWENIFKQLG